MKVPLPHHTLKLGGTQGSQQVGGYLGRYILLKFGNPLRRKRISGSIKVFHRLFCAGGGVVVAAIAAAAASYQSRLFLMILLDPSRDAGIIGSGQNLFQTHGIMMDVEKIRMMCPVWVVPTTGPFDGRPAHARDTRMGIKGIVAFALPGKNILGEFRG